MVATGSGPAGKLRACLNCGILKPVSFFKANGCPNCPFLRADKINNLNMVTSGSFRGVVCLLDPRRSWVANWQRINSYVPGAYALTVDGVLGDEYIARIENEGLVYFNRSTSFALE